ncbi:M14 family metallopeptidase [Shewanella algidipiscicola]|uniref:N-acetyl-L-ornithine deacetylase ArgE n=1 Tax=Shewanella algidipiscicola TaxID=614070 RepID=A0ABQ4PMG5_9GAMM|nr:M14 family metallocarboxypeptidase [Shewanella algidipiscicola]GIU49349.1 N-acetyl-L-ornithine deacetylase ArgE [Shewanella algidipiscicola]
MSSRDPFASYTWKSDIFSCESNDISTFYACLKEQVTRLGLLERTLGDAGRYPLNLYQSPAQKSGQPSLLISAGFHGEEAAGPWGMLHFLNELEPELFQRINLSLLPLVNPTGFKRGHRFNKLGQNPNRGFLVENGRGKSNDDTSAEGKILLEHSQLLQAASKEGILTCHEDVLQNDTYIYSFEANQTPGHFSRTLRDTLGEFFPIAPDGFIDDCPVADGIIFNHFDLSFEAFLVRLGANVGVCSETPGKQNFDQRVLANSAIMQTFIEQVIARQ